MKALLSVCCCAVTYSVAFAQSEITTADSIDAKTLDEVVVTGEYPGPGLWKVSKVLDDGEHALWIFGAPPPISKNWIWSSKQLEQVAAQSKLLLWDSGLTVVPEEDFGMFRAITLLPAILSARKNPNGQRLQEVVPADLYTRWLLQKQRYLGGDRSIEKWRPLFAADELKEKTLKDLDLGASAAGGVVRKLAKEHGLKTVSPMITVKLREKGIRSTIKQFSRQPLDDIECFAATLAFTESLSDRDTSNARATAWVTGNLKTLRRLPPLPDLEAICDVALMSSEALAQYNVGDLRQRLQVMWLDAAEESIGANATTLAVLPIGELLKSDGRLSILRARGYTVEEPI